MFSGVNMNRVFLRKGTAVSRSSASAADHTRCSRQNYDQFEFLEQPEGQEKRFRELVAQIAGEIRLHPTRGQLSQLKSQIEDGTYQPDPQEIAARMLLTVKEDA